MEIPRASRPQGLPEIFVQDSNPHDRYRTLSRSSSYNSAASPSSIPMSIPNSREPVPPPLPPPRHLADIASGGDNGPDIAWKWGNLNESNHGWGGSMSSSVAPGSSLYGGSFASRKSSFMEDRPEHFRRQSSTATIKSAGGMDARDNSYSRDEGYASLSGTSIGSNLSKYQDSTSGRSFQSSVHDQYRSNNAQAYDKSLLQKLDSRRGSDNKTPPRGYHQSAFSSSATESSPTTRMALDHRHPTQLKPLSLPIITSRPHFAESPVARWTDSPLSSAISPKNSYPRFGGSGHHESKLSADAMDYERSPLSYSRRSGSESMSVADDASSVTSRSRDSYDARVSPDNDVDFQMEETGLRRLHIEDYSSRTDPYSPSATTGQKRRASSPPGDEGPTLHTAGSGGDLFRRRECAARASPAPPYHSTSGSISSTGSAPRNNSYASTMSLSTGSVASLGSFGRLSPGGISPNTDISDSPYVTSISLNSSPGSSISRQLGHQRVTSEARPLMTARKLSESISHSKTSGAPRMQGVFMCECCPKKPKKFESQEDLNAHEQEKQYECAYCRNRFKNKNEAERHQNSLHLRRHSWSCAALAGYEAVFHTSPNRPDADTCGYCGEDFPRCGFSSPAPGNGPQISIPTDQDWEVRITHLQEMHKFGECNHAKKFFRADHFRQHLKHSHAGTSGKWTNMLENACMKDEPLPEPIRGPDRMSPGGSGRVGIIDEEEEIL